MPVATRASLRATRVSGAGASASLGAGERHRCSTTEQQMQVSSVQRSDRDACADIPPATYSPTPPTNVSARISNAVARVMRAHMMGSRVLNKEPAMPAGEESLRIPSTSPTPAPALALAPCSPHPSTSWPAPTCTPPPMRTTCSTWLSPTSRPHRPPLTTRS